MSTIRKKFAVLTSGGDSPSMNAAVYSFVSSATSAGHEVYGVIDGYKGLINADFKKLNPTEFKSNLCLSGTAIGSSRCKEFRDNSVRIEAVNTLRKHGFHGLVVIGGDGSYMGANYLSGLDFPIVALPGTIDNDIASTHYTIGFFSALEEIFQAIKKIKSTSDSHRQITIVEAMGRDCPDLSIAAALAAGADYVITNQNPTKERDLVKILKTMISKGDRRGIVIVVTEKVYGEKYEYGLPSLTKLCPRLEKKLGRQVRHNVLGYTQRGAVPTSWDLFVSQGFGIEAFKLLSSGVSGVSVGFNGFDFYTTPLSEAVELPRKTSFEFVEFINSRYKI